MKRKILYFASILMVFALAACGSDAPPTLSAADTEGTAIALAWTSLAQTQAALPTLTPSPIPPTQTPAPTFTPFPTIAPLNPTNSVFVATTPTIHPCNDVPPSKPNGDTVQVKFINESGGQVNLAFGMNDKNEWGECGTYSFTLGRFDEPVVTVLAGCYWAWGWITGDTPSVAKNIGLLCVNDLNKTVVISVGKETIGFH